MNSPYTCKQLPYEWLLVNDLWDLHPFLPASEPFPQQKQAFDTVGILLPPLVIEQAADKYELVTGKRHVAALLDSQKENHIWCRVVQSDLDPNTLLGLIYYEYTYNAAISVIELAHFYKLVTSVLHNEHNLLPFLRDLGLKVSQSSIHRALELLKLEPSLQQGMMSKQLSEQNGRDLLTLSSEDRLELFALYKELNLGGSKQRRIFQLLRDLSGRHQTSINSLLNDGPIQEIRNHQQMNTPQKSQTLLKHLSRLHSPSLHEAEAEFTKWQKSLTLPPSCRIEHSPAFEKDAITLTIDFNGRKQLEDYLTTLSDDLVK